MQLAQFSNTIYLLAIQLKVMRKFFSNINKFSAGKNIFHYVETSAELPGNFTTQILYPPVLFVLDLTSDIMVNW